MGLAGWIHPVIVEMPQARRSSCGHEMLSLPLHRSTSGSSDRMYRFVLLIVGASLTTCAYADCANDVSQIKQALPPEALSVRAALVSQLCATSELFDITDPTLTGRLTTPSNIVAPAMWETHGVRGNLLLGFAVDVHGIVQQVTVLMSSGNRELDAAAVESWRTARYKTPAKLDGRPVRVLMYFRFKSKVNGS